MLKMAMKMTLASDKADQGEGDKLAPEGVADRDLHGATHRCDAPQADEDTVEQAVSKWPLPRPISLMASRTVTRTPQDRPKAASSGAAMAITLCTMTTCGSGRRPSTSKLSMPEKM